MTRDEARPANAVRRRMLRWMVLAAVGSGIALLGLGFLPKTSKSASGETNSGGAVFAPSASSMSAVGNPSASSVRIKTVYFQMSQYVGQNVEYFVLQSPAYFGELLKEILGKHPISQQWYRP